jgi:hypothetical protein
MLIANRVNQAHVCCCGEYAMRRWLMRGAMIALFGGMALPAAAQVRTIDPNRAIDSDLSGPPPHQQSASTQSQSASDTYQDRSYQDQGVPPDNAAPADNGYAPPPPPPQSAPAPVDQTRRDQASESADTYSRDDLLGAAEGVFGKGAEGLAGILENILKDQGRPNAYIAGREASGAFVVGLRYGSGVLTSKIEGQQPVYWTGPSVGFDVGGDANKVFVLVYNLYDTEELFKRFPAGEGHLYFVGGFSASYLRSGNTVLIPIRLGVGWRAGVNVGYMKFTHHSKWLPF